MGECLNDRIKRLLKDQEDIKQGFTVDLKEVSELITETQIALIEQYEENLKLAETLTETQLALCEIYELMGVY